LIEPAVIATETQESDNRVQIQHVHSSVGKYITRTEVHVLETT